MSPSLTTSKVLFRFADDATLWIVARASGAQLLAKIPTPPRKTGRRSNL